MKVSLPREKAAGERRVALVPEAAEKLRAAGATLAVERGAGERAFFTDDAYRAAGAGVVERASLFEGADVVARVGPPASEEIDEFPPGAVLAGFLRPLDDRSRLERLAARGLTALALEMIPRVSRAQAMDALSSMSTVAGYQAVLLAAGRLPKFFPLLMTAAGTIPPARGLILGAGVAGLQAIATARRLGAVVEAFDVRPEVKEQVESLGAAFVAAPEVAAEGKGGYAAELSGEAERRELEAIGGRLGEADFVISTALIPGKRAPLLLTREMVGAMTPGSVIVDLAAEAGGNCELSRPGEEAEHRGVTVLAPLNLASSLPLHASRMYSRNLSALLLHLIEDGEIRLDFEDPVIDGCCVVHNGEVRV
ncbi:MAG: Re/Si-specific NAD(P)(+) transhydrogenase subunit alpha [Longimicrobiaceae bacterium]